MSEISCLRCRQSIDSDLEQCPNCGERVTLFQRTYSARLIDGKYQILDRLGVGGMGEIFRVRHIHLNELRVIKIMRPNVASDDQGLQRFLQEARTSTTIKHRNLAMLYDFAQLEDGSYYMVWEYIDGTNIQKWIAQNGPVPPRLAVEISIQALHGLDHLHSMGLIHRDISPENIMLSQDQKGKLLVKVIDFGIAKSLAEGETGHGLTQTGMFLGKLKYASPEQAGFLKEDEHLDPRSDLYSFGIVMYEMLAGRAPFQATNPHGYILKHVTEKPAPIAETNPDVKVPPALEAITMKSLEKSRDNRYADAGDFVAALEGVRSDVAPDAKYGLGDKLVTLSGAKTLADLPAFTGGTMQGGTKAARTVGRAADEATVIERGVSGGTASGSAPTVVERKTTAADEATVMERVGGAAGAPTVLEAKGKFGSSAAAEPTVLERQMQPAATAPKKNFAVISAIAAVVVIAIAIGIYMTIGRQSRQTVVTATAVPSTTALTATAPSGSAIPGDRGVLLLSASPWGNIDKIVNAKDQSKVDLPTDASSTPARIELAPGKYLVTISGINGTRQTINVDIRAGQPTTQKVDMGRVDIENLIKEMNQ
jgi:serine/threonine protein kinase